MGLKSRASKGAEESEKSVAVKAGGADVNSEAPSNLGAMIDSKSMADYKKQFENHRLQNRHATVAEIVHHVKEYIKKRIDGIVDEACRKRIMDISTVALSVMSSTVIPFSGVAVVVAATVIQCLNFSVTLGLIPLLNVRSFNDLASMSSQIGSTIKRASKSSVMAGVETAVLEILKNLGVGDWLWAEILKDILVEMIGDSAIDAAWIMTPLLAAPKYMLHRHLVKKMYRKLGDKAHVVHHAWMEQNCVGAVGIQTVVGGVQVDEHGNVQGAYLQSQGVFATQVRNGNGALVGAQAQVSQTNAYFQPQNGVGAQAQVSQTNAFFQQQNGAGAQAQVSQTNAYFQPQNGAGAQGGAQAQVSQTNAYFQPQNGGAQAQVSPPNAYFQPQAAQQWPAYPPTSQSANANPPASMATGYPQVPMQPDSNSKPSFFQPQPAPKKNATLIMGYTPPANSSFFQPQVQPQGTKSMGHTNSSFFQSAPTASQPGVFQAAAAAVTYTPQTTPTYFEQPAPMYGTQPMYPPQGNPYVQMGDYNKMQTPVAYPQAGNQQGFPPQGGYQASAPPPDLWYQQQAN